MKTGWFDIFLRYSNRPVSHIELSISQNPTSFLKVELLIFTDLIKKKILDVLSLQSIQYFDR